MSRHPDGKDAVAAMAVAVAAVIVIGARRKAEERYANGFVDGITGRQRTGLSGSTEPDRYLAPVISLSERRSRRRKQRGNPA